MPPSRLLLSINTAGEEASIETTNAFTSFPTPSIQKYLDMSITTAATKKKEDAKACSSSFNDTSASVTEFKISIDSDETELFE